MDVTSWNVLIRRKLYLPWSQFDQNNVIQTTNKLYRGSEQRTFSTELFETLSQLNHCVAKLFTVLNCSNRIADHFIQNGTSKRVLRFIWFITGLESAFRESFDSERDFIVHFMNHFIRTGNKTNSAEAGMYRPEEVKSSPPPTPLQIAPLCVCVYIYSYI